MLFLVALLTGALSAFAFAPVGLWPLMPLAIAALCELIWRSKCLRQALAVGWGFGLGQFVIGLNWIATAFTFQAAMPAWLGWIAVVLLSLYLAVYPAIAAGLAWRFKDERPIALVIVTRRSMGDHRMAARNDVHGLPVEPARRNPRRHAFAQCGERDRHLRPVACWLCSPAGCCGFMCTSAGTGSPASSSLSSSQCMSAAQRRNPALPWPGHPRRPAEHRPGG